MTFVYLVLRCQKATVPSTPWPFSVCLPEGASLMMTYDTHGLLLPMIIFFLGQRAFMRGVVITGVEK